MTKADRNRNGETLNRRLGWLVAAIVWAGLLTNCASAQDGAAEPILARSRFRSGEEVLRALAPVSAATRHSIVKLNVDGETVALGTVVDTNGWALTKASEIKPGKLTCWLATDQEVEAELLATDVEEDVALVRVHAQGLTPITWSPAQVSVGEWAITPGIAETPQAIGIISALPRRIRPQRALIGVRFDPSSPLPRIDELLPGYGAEKAGLKPGDIILTVNNTAVSNRQQVVEILGDFRDGQTVRLGLQREDEHFDAQLEMIAALEEEGQSLRMAGRVSHRAQGFERAIEHDTVLFPWLCGGPLVDLDGKAMGLNIARASRVTTYALPASLVQKILENLKANARLQPM